MTISSQQNSFFMHDMIALNLIIVSPGSPSSLSFKTQLRTFLQNHFCADSLKDSLDEAPPELPLPLSPAGIPGIPAVPARAGRCLEHGHGSQSWDFWSQARGAKPGF